MEIIALTRVISELTLYFSATGFMMRFASTTAYDENLVLVESGGAFLQLVVLVAIYMLSYFLRRKKWLSMPCVLLLPTVFLLSQNIVDSIWMALPTLLIAIHILRGNYGCDRKRFMRTFKYAAPLAAICVFLYLFIPYDGKGENGTPLFFLLYIISSVVLMRSLRQSDEVLSSRAYKLSNLSLVGGALLVVAGLGYLFNRLSLSLDLASVADALNRFGTWLAGIIPALGELHIFRLGDYNAPGLDVLFEGFKDPTQLDPQHTMTVYGLPVGTIIGLLAIALAAVAVIAVIVWRRRAIRVSEDHSSGDRDDVCDEPQAAYMRNELTSDNRGNVRRYYRKFLTLCRKRNIPVNTYDTSLDIQNAAERSFDTAALDEIREVYVAARYDDAAQIDDTQLARAKAAYAAIKRNG